jgi:oligopeptide/dipeptide ABC transporter ATP-binding protein
VGTLLEVRNLKTHFFTADGTIKAVDDISYDLNEGEFSAIVGESGCGKSVNALSIMRLVPHPPGRIVGGEIIFEGQDLLQLDERTMRSIRGNRIAMIFQEPMTSLNPVFTVGSQISESLRLHLNMDKRQAWVRSLELMEMVGIPDGERRIRDYPHQFIGGMRQRVMIAMALSCNPKLIIADEPTTALDVTIQAQVLDLLKGVAEQSGTAVIMITHNLGIVARYAARVNVMYAGKMVEQGTAEDIFHNSRHPYTLGLLDSVPRMDMAPHERLRTIEGLPPDLIDVPTGCYFNPRCSYATGRCFEDSPSLVQVSDAHTSACWEWQKLESHEKVGGGA